MLYSILSQINKGLRRIPILRQTRFEIQPHYGLAWISRISLFSVPIFGVNTIGSRCNRPRKEGQASAAASKYHAKLSVFYWKVLSNPVVDWLILTNNKIDLIWNRGSFGCEGIIYLHPHDLPTEWRYEVLMFFRIVLTPLLPSFHLSRWAPW